MRYSRTPPGDSPVADAYNLMVAAHRKDKRMTDTVSESVRDWSVIAAHLAAIASLYAGYADFVTPGENRPTDLLADLADNELIAAY
jgi:hypothetical protein